MNSSFYFVLVLGSISILKGDLSIIHKRAATKRTWPSRTIAYSFDPDNSYSRVNELYIESILKDFEKELEVNGEKCIIFVSKTNEKDYIQFGDSSECSSGIGYVPGVNKVQLASTGCLNKGTIFHEIMHRLGFDHEHSRLDRDEYVYIQSDSLTDRYKKNYEINQHLDPKTKQDSPYDYYSILHYNSDDFSKENIKSIYPSILDTKILKYKKEHLSSIDKIQLQRMFNCKQSALPVVIRPNSPEEVEYFEYYKSKVEKEAKRLGFNVSVATDYLKRSIETCGYSHFWPLDYPIVKKHHPLYESICLPKKVKNELCKFSIECKNPEFECVKVLFRNGVCKKSEVNRFAALARILQGKAGQFGTQFKEEASDFGHRIITSASEFGKDFKQSFDSSISILKGIFKVK